MSVKEFNIGDQVRVIALGASCCGYRDWEEFHGVTGVSQTLLPEKDKQYSVIAAGFHGRDLINGSPRILYGITDGSRSYVVGQEGLVKWVEYEWQWLLKHKQDGKFYTTEWLTTDKGIDDKYYEKICLIEESKRPKLGP